MEEIMKRAENVDDKLKAPLIGVLRIVVVKVEYHIGAAFGQYSSCWEVLP